MLLVQQLHAIKDYGSVIFHVVSWIITIVLVFVLCTPITNLIIDKTNFDDRVSSKIEQNLKNTYSKNFAEGTTISSDDSNISNAIVDVINDYIIEANEKEVENIAGYVANEITHIVISAVVILGLFIVARFISMLLKFTLDIIVRLPIFNTFNKIGGIIYGILRAFIVIYVILAVIALLSPTLTDSNLIALIKSSHIASIFYNDNIILNYLTK